MSRKGLLIILAAGLWSLCSALAHAEDGDESPDIPFIFVDAIPDDNQYLVDVDWDRSDELKAIEQVARRSLKRYRELGFGAPQLTRFLHAEPGTGKPRPFYALLRGGTRSAAGAAYNPPCEADEDGNYTGPSPYDLTFIRVNMGGMTDGATISDTRQMFSEGRRKPWAHVALAHEIFHAIQFAYPPFRNCTVDGWITEGTATAISRHVVRFATKEQVPAYPNRWELLVRPYDRALRVVDLKDPESYRTASFWRFLAEDAGHDGKASPGGSFDIEREDYQYLVDLLEANLDRGADSAAATRQEYLWVDRAVRKNASSSLIGGGSSAGLDAAYSRFVTQFPRYIPERLNRPDGGSPRTQSELLADALGGCITVHLKTERPHSVQSVDLPRFGARCLSVSTDREGQVTVAIGFGAADEALINRLRVGHIESGWVATQSTTSKSKDALGAHYAHWNFTVLASGEETHPRNTFTLINFPDLSKPLTVDGDSEAAARSDRLTLYVTLPHWSSQTFPPESQGPPMQGAVLEPGPATERLVYLTQRPPGSSGPVLAAAAAPPVDGLRLTSFAESTQTIQLDLDDQPCSDAFVYRACGPDVRINLSLKPASGLGSISRVAGTGGFLEQLGEQLGEQGAAFGRDPGLMQRYRDRLRETRGSEISITTPPFDYGFSGTFSNAQVIVSTPDGSLQALSPRDEVPGRGTRHRLNGRVTIEEFSPYVLRGRVQADLVDRSKAPPGEDVMLPVVDTLDARFVVAAPHLNDRRSIVVAGRPWDSSANRRFYERSPRSGGVPGGSAAGSGGVAGSGGTVRCACTCNEGPELTSPCDEICEPVMAACRPPAAKAAQEAEIPEAGERGLDDASALRAEYEELIRATGAGEAGIRAAMERFDMMPPPVQEMLLEMQRRDSREPEDGNGDG